MLAAGTLQTWQRIDTLALPLAVDVGDRCGEASDYVPDRRRFFHLLRFLRSLG